jgi:hypothetical protein
MVFISSNIDLVVLLADGNVGRISHVSPSLQEVLVEVAGEDALRERHFNDFETLNGMVREVPTAPTASE